MKGVGRPGGDALGGMRERERLREDVARGVRNDVSHQSRVQYPGQSELNVMLTAK